MYVLSAMRVLIAVVIKCAHQGGFQNSVLQHFKVLASSAFQYKESFQ